MATASKGRGQAWAGVSAAAVKKATGCDWERWFSCLDRAGCAAMTHTQIARLVHERWPKVGGWWAQMVTVGGNVVLMQGKNVLKGDRLVIDLKTGESRFENKGNTEAGGRIRALFMPEDAKPGDDSSKDGKSGGKKSADKSGDKDAGKGDTAAPKPAEAAPAAE